MPKPLPNRDGMTYREKYLALCEFIADTERAVCGESERLNTMYLATADDGRADVLMGRIAKSHAAFRLARDMKRFVDDLDAIEVTEG